MAAVNRFYDESYFRPSVVWRIVREALWNADDRKRLTAGSDRLSQSAGRAPQVPRGRRPAIPRSRARERSL